MKTKVLLVDDTRTVRAFEKLALGADFEFIEAADGEEAVARAEEHQPQVILLDVMMPTMNGIDALRTLKSRESTRAIPVIMVTTRSEDDVRSTCEALGCAAFVYKPINRDELQERVREQLSRKP